jgi:sugar lactone lactonase YvrE
MQQPEVFRRAHAILGESLVWDPDAREMLWCDITTGHLHRSPIDGAVDGSDDTMLVLPPPLASFARTSVDGRPGYVASLGDRVVLVDAADGSGRELAVIHHLADGLRLNEGKVDPAGRWVTGSMNLTTGDPDGAFYSIGEYLSVRVLVGGIGVANGLEWSVDGSTIYFTDTSVKTIYRAEYTAAGEVEGIAEFITGESFDGLAMDETGSFWASVYGGGVVIHSSAEGRELERIAFPAPNLTSVAFGGDDLSTLFVASARENLTEQQLEAAPLSGSVFSLATSARGRVARSFTVG